MRVLPPFSATLDNRKCKVELGTPAALVVLGLVCIGFLCLLGGCSLPAAAAGSALASTLAPGPRSVHSTSIQAPVDQSYRYRELRDELRELREESRDEEFRDLRERLDDVTDRLSDTIDDRIRQQRRDEEIERLLRRSAPSSQVGHSSGFAVPRDSDDSGLVQKFRSLYDG